MRHEITSPMSATVWEVAVEEQARVNVGDDLVILESMKMEIPVPSPVAGAVISIAATAGASVDEGQVLIVVEGD